MTEFLDVPGGQIAYDVTGEGPLVVMAHGMGTNRTDFRLLAPLIAAAGYRVATTDVRGLGESSTDWPSHTRTDTAGDILELIRTLGGPAVIIGHSFSGGSATIAAAQAPELVSAVVEICPFTRVPKVSIGALITNRRHRIGALRLIRTGMTGSIGTWTRYLDHAYPIKPADYDEWLAALQQNLREPGRMAATRKMGQSRPSDAEQALPKLTRPALVVMGSLDPDWPDPAADAAGIVADMPEGIGAVAIIDGTGHYPHAQRPDEVATAVLTFLADHAGA